MKLKFTILGITLGLVACLLQGCLVAAVGAGVGAVKYGSAKQRQAYSEYRTATERINLEREQSGLDPVRILTLDEWRKGKEEKPEEDK